MENKKVCSQKIYGYDEELWYRVINGSDKTGDQAVKRLMPLLEEYGVGNRVLDLGCGVGRISNRLAFRGYDVVGIDLSGLCIKTAEEKAKEMSVEDKTRYIVGDYTKLEEFGAEKFDIALCINAPAWKTPLEITSFFSKLAPFMHPKGLLICQDTLKEAFLNALYSCPNVQNWYALNGEVLSLHSWRYNPENGIVSAVKEFYEKTSGGFSFISRITGESKLRSLADYMGALKRAGWDIIQVDKPALDLFNLEAYNDPWLINTAIITANLKANT